MSLLTLLKARIFGAGGGTPSLPQITTITPPVYPDAVLGCGQPVAEVWDRGGNQRILALPGLTEASWGRVLADTSDGVVTLAGQAISSDPACCEVLRTVRPWKHELHVYRDNELQWCGPITEIEAGGDSIQIKARDLSAWLDHRLVHQTHIYGGQGVAQGATDTTVIFGDLVTDALAPDTSPNLTLDFGIVAGVLAQGNYTPASFKTVGPLIRELAKGSIDWFVIKRVLTYTGGGASTPAAGSGLNVTAASISNPGFEVNTTGWSLSGGWTLTRDTGTFHTGTASGKATWGGLGAPSRPALTTSVTSLQVGKSYTISVWLRTTAWLSGGNNGGEVTIAGQTSTGWVYPSSQGAFVKFSVTFVATSTNHTLSIRPSGVGSVSGTTTWYTDDVDLVLNNPDAQPASAPSAVTPAFYLNDDDLAEPARITLSGLNQENRSIVADQQSGGDVAFYGEAPSPAWSLNTLGPGLTTDQAEYGLLEGSTTAPLADAASAQSQANQRSDLLSDTPVILNSLVLSPNAGVTMTELIPGSLVGVQLDRSCIGIRETMLIRQVQVRTSPSGGEQVTLTLEPAGGS